MVPNTKTFQNAVEPRTIGIVAFLSVGVTALVTHQAGTLVPYLSIFTGIGLLAIIFGAIVDDQHYTEEYLGLVVCLSVFHHVYGTLFVPTLYGFDPDGYAAIAHLVATTGTTDSLSIFFYQSAPIHVLVLAAFSLVAGVTTASSALLYDLTFGILIPLFTAIFINFIIEDRSAVVVGAALASLVGITTHFVLMPIAQLSALLFVLLTYMSILYYEERFDPRFVIIFFLAVIGALLSHKIPLLVVLGILGIFVVLSIKCDANNELSAGIRLAAVVAGVFVIQGIILTGLLEGQIYKLWIALSTGITYNPATFEPAAAVNAYTISDRTRRLAYLVILLFMSGASWLYFVVFERRNTSVRIVLSIAAVTVMLAVGGQLIGLINPIRAILTGEVVFVALSVGLIFRLRNFEVDTRLWRSGAILVVTLLLMTSAASSFTTPDDGTSYYRTYLTNSEVTAKDFGFQHAKGPIYTDLFYYHESPPREISHDETTRRDWSGRYRSGSAGYLNGTIHEKGYRTIAFRTTLDRYRGEHGIYRLTWQPNVTLDRQYHRTYDNGDVVFYNCVDCESNTTTMKSP